MSTSREAAAAHLEGVRGEGGVRGVRGVRLRASAEGSGSELAPRG